LKFSFVVVIIDIISQCFINLITFYRSVCRLIRLEYFQLFIQLKYL
jgi:hypothetical protein